MKDAEKLLSRYTFLNILRATVQLAANNTVALETVNQWVIIYQPRCLCIYRKAIIIRKKVDPRQQFWNCISIYLLFKICQRWWLCNFKQMAGRCKGLGESAINFGSFRGLFKIMILFLNNSLKNWCCQY